MALAVQLILPGRCKPRRLRDRVYFVEIDLYHSVGRGDKLEPPRGFELIPSTRWRGNWRAVATFSITLILVLSLQWGHDLIGQGRIDAPEIVRVERDHLIYARFPGRMQQQGIIDGGTSDPQTGQMVEQGHIVGRG